MLPALQILNDITGNLDAKKACTGAMKLHKKYLKKVFIFPLLRVYYSLCPVKFSTESQRNQ